ncbi:MAG: hypothetical protein EPO12_03770 [Aquabacterium sp.]|nr:MAG: hypothetical protein EPO12_03770 [Aquabacterium sp.]
MKTSHALFAMPLAVLALASTSAHAAPPTCPGSVTVKFLYGGSGPAQDAVKAAIDSIPADRSGLIRFSGTFNFTAPVPVRRDCISFNSTFPAFPATLRWQGTAGDNTFILDNADPNGGCVASGTCITPHHTIVNNLSFEGAGIRLNGYAPEVTYSRFKNSKTALWLQFTDNATVLGNAFTDTVGVSSWNLRYSRIGNNVFTRAVQPVGIAGSSIQNTIDGNTGTGSVMFSIELLGGNETLAANARNVGNAISGNTFSAPSAPLNDGRDHGAYGGISLASGTSNTISGNNVSCPALCPAIGIEASGVATTVTGNTVGGYDHGIYVGESQPGNPADDTTLVQDNTVSNVSYGIAVSCAPGGANGTDALNPRLAGCRKTVNIVHNTVTEPKVAGIGGYGDFFTPYTLDAQGKPVYVTYPSGDKQRYTLNTVSELRGLTIQNNTVTRTFGTYADDTNNDVAQFRFSAVSVGPILDAAKLWIDNNQLTLKGVPAAGQAFRFNGVSIGLSVLADTGHCVRLAGSKTLQGARVTANRITHTPSPFGAALRASCNATNGLVFTGNTIDGTSDAVLDESTTGLSASGNTCTNVTSSTVGC